MTRCPLSEAARLLRSAEPATLERGGVSASRRLKSVYRGRVALVGDASGSVDAITGEGLCLLFQQAVALAGALEAGDLCLYQASTGASASAPSSWRRSCCCWTAAAACAAAPCAHLKGIRASSPACSPCTWESFHRSIL